MRAWLNSNPGVVLSIGLAAIAIACSVAASLLGAQLYNQGTIITELGTIKDWMAKKDVKDDAFRAEVNQRFDELQIAFDTDQTDLKQILVATGTVSEGDVFWAANYRDSIWVFPGDALQQKFIASGMTPEPMTKFLTGYRVMPALEGLPPSDKLLPVK